MDMRSTLKFSCSLGYESNYNCQAARYRKLRAHLLTQKLNNGQNAFLFLQVMFLW